jgi:uncharacterized membrane protein
MNFFTSFINTTCFTVLGAMSGLVFGDIIKSFKKRRTFNVAITVSIGAFLGFVRGFTGEDIVSNAKRFF